jgi:hypothetical protein
MAGMDENPWTSEVADEDDEVMAVVVMAARCGGVQVLKVAWTGRDDALS